MANNSGVAFSLLFSIYIFLPDICTFGRKYFYILLSDNCSSYTYNWFFLKFTQRVTILTRKEGMISHLAKNEILTCSIEYFNILATVVFKAEQVELNILL